MEEFAAGHPCEVCGDPAVCGVVDMIEGGWKTDEIGVRFWVNYSGEHSTHYFCGFHERDGKVYPRSTRPAEAKR